MPQGQHLAIERVHVVEGLLEPELPLERAPPPRWGGSGRPATRPRSPSWSSPPARPPWIETSRRGSRIWVPRWWRCSSRSVLPAMPLQPEEERDLGPTEVGPQVAPGRRDTRPGARRRDRPAPGAADRGGRRPSGAADGGCARPGPPSSGRPPRPPAERARRSRPFPLASGAFPLADRLRSMGHPRRGPTPSMRSSGFSTDQDERHRPRDWSSSNVTRRPIEANFSGRTPGRRAPRRSSGLPATIPAASAPSDRTA